MITKNGKINVPVKSMLMNKAAHNRTPINGTFEITSRCNMNCKMCYIRMSPEEQACIGKEKTAEEWIALGKECAESGLLFLLITGGEPFLRSDFREIYDGLKKLGFIISINTNGTLLTKETVKWLKKDPPASVNLTLYGAGSETYKKICGFENGFERAINAIELLKEAGISVVLNISLTKLNCDDLEKMIEIGRKYDLPIRIASYIFPPVRKLNCKTDFATRFSAKQCGDMRFRSMKAQLPKEHYERLIAQLQNGNFDIVGNDECELTDDGPMTCMAGKSSFWVTWSGKMTPCAMLDVPCAKPFEIGVKASWKAICEKTDEISMPSECSSCPAKQVCRVCAAISTAESGGNASVKPEYLCESTKQFLKRVKEEQITKE